MIYAGRCKWTLSRSSWCHISSALCSSTAPNYKLFEEVANLPAVVWLKVRNNKSLRGLSNLRSLERLLAQDCPALGIVKLPHSLQKVFLVDCRMEEDIRACLPQHLGILLHASTTGGDDRDMFPNESIYNWRVGQSVSVPCFCNAHARTSSMESSL